MPKDAQALRQQRDCFAKQRRISRPDSTKTSSVFGTLHEFLSEMLGANRKSVTMAAQALQSAGLISYRRGKIQVVDRAGLEKASCECYAIVKERFDAFLTPPSTAVQGDTGPHKR